MEILILTVLLSAAQEERGRPGVPRLERPRPAGEWKLDGKAGGDLRYNSNVFLLDGDHQDRLEQERPGDQTSGRYEDMESVDDFIFVPDLRFGAQGPSPLGRKAEVFLDLEYHHYFRNAARSHAEAALGLGQAVGPDGHLGLKLSLLPDSFNKNYLVDAVDLDGDGDISSSERRYDHGTYREWELELEYRHSIVEPDKTQSFGLDGAAALGYHRRDYGSAFPGRDEEAPSLTLALKARFGGAFKAGISYRYERVETPTESEVLLLDETAFGIDFSGDGDTADNDARSVQRVDRSRPEQSLKLWAEVGLGPGWDLEVFVRRMVRDFESDERFDVSHRDREDVRDEAGVAVKLRIAKDWDARLGYEWRRQETDRPGDPGAAGEVLDYKRNLFFLSVSFSW